MSKTLIGIFGVFGITISITWIVVVICFVVKHRHSLWEGMKDVWNNGL
jgi:hypothetical protein